MPNPKPPLLEGAQTLHELPGRAVWREGADVLKAFHAPGPISRGAFKARRELQGLQTLARLGLRVPTPVRLERRQDWLVVRMPHIEGAMALDRWLETAGASNPAGSPERGPPTPRRATLGDLADQLARAMSAGVQQGDAHPGNFLVDRQGAVWTVDMERIRVRSSFDPAAALVELARLGALLDPLTHMRERLEALDAWLEALCAEQRLALPSRRILIRQLAAASEQHRRLEIRRELDRWLRPSSRLSRLQAPDTEVPHPGGPKPQRAGLWKTAWGLGALLRSGAPQQTLLATHLDASQRETARAWARGARPSRGSAVEFQGPKKLAQARWLAACAELEHGLPVLSPAAIETRGRRWRLLFLGRGSLEPIWPDPSQAAAIGARRAARGLEPLGEAISWFLDRKDPAAGARERLCYLPFMP